MKEFTEISLRHLDLSENFFDLVQAVLQENIKQGNKNVSVQAPSINKVERNKEYRRQTKWSDNRILIPVLFNFFHGIELFLKGLKYLNDDPALKTGKTPHHNLETLLNDFKKENTKEKSIYNILKYYILPNNECQILSNFYKSNKISNSSMFYDFFKYPSNKSFDKVFNYSALRCNGVDGMIFFKKIIDDIDKLREELELME